MDVTGYQDLRLKNVEEGKGLLAELKSLAEREGWIPQNMVEEGKGLLAELKFFPLKRPEPGCVVEEGKGLLAELKSTKVIVSPRLWSLSKRGKVCLQN